MTFETDPDRYRTVSAKVPVELADRFADYAESQLLSTSALLRQAMDRTLSDAAGADPVGMVEASLIREMESAGWRVANETMVATALNLARRLDTDAANGAALAGQLRSIVDSMRPDPAAQTFDIIDEIKARRILRLAGWTIDQGNRLAAYRWERFGRVDD